MAVGLGYKTFTFDGESSGDYGIYITGSGVYNAPERVVEMIEIPGRNGAFAQDKGRFQNVEVTYPAGTFGDDQEDFAEKLSDLRNMLASRKGYCRLEDEYNPDEYRLAVFKSGLDVDPVSFQRAGEFSITFECMPQRFLKSGETATAVASGGTITNPTLFDASPLLEVTGYGNFAINGVPLEIVSSAIGEVPILSETKAYQKEASVDFDNTYANSGDPINVAAGYNMLARMQIAFQVTATKVVQSVSVVGSPIVRPSIVNNTGSAFTLLTDIVAASMSYGTAFTRSITTTMTVTFTDSSTTTINIDFLSYKYDGTKTITCKMVFSNMTGFQLGTGLITFYPLVLNSSQSALGNPLYFDLDIGEAYKIENGVAVSVNNSVTIPAELPKLEPGTNTITFDNTITQLKIVPRWWKV